MTETQTTETSRTEQDIKAQVLKVCDLLNLAQIERFKATGYTNSAFFVDTELKELTEQYKFKTGEIYNIKAYGVPDRNKKKKADLGNVFNYNTLNDALNLLARRYNYLK